MTRFLLVNGSFHRNWHRCYWASSASPAVARRGRRRAAGATQRFFHAVNVQLGCDTLYRSKPYSGVWTRADHRTASPTAARSTSRGARSTGARSWLATSTPASRRSSGRCAPARMLRSSRWRPCPTASTSRWSATRSMESTGGLVKANKVVQAAPAPGVRHAAVAAPNTVDQLILRRDRRRLDPGGRQGPCPEPTRRLSHTPCLPGLKPGVSRAPSDERGDSTAGLFDVRTDSAGRVRCSPRLDVRGGERSAGLDLRPLQS
jgi:hypothetical protein